VFLLVVGRRCSENIVKEAERVSVISEHFRHECEPKTSVSQTHQIYSLYHIMMMMDISVLEFCLVNFLSYLCGVATGLVICCKNKETFLQRQASVENLSQYNHQVQAQPLASAPTFPEITIK
jgi:hypothetical protein